MSDRRANLEYSLIQSLYWSGYCVAFSFAAVFLQERGYTNTELGLVLTAGNVAGFALAPALAGMLDRYKRLRSTQFIIALLGVQALCLTVFLLVPGRCAAVSIGYAVYLLCVIVITPLVTQLSMELEALGCGVSFGVARGLGSIAFALTSALTGYLASLSIRSILTLAGFALVAAQLAAVSAVDAQARRMGVTVRAAPEDRQDSSSLVGFIAKNKRFCVLMLGVAALFFSHNLMNNYLINIVRAVGGDTADMGGLNAYFAVIEAPVMFAFTAIARKLSCTALLRISSAAFALKALCIAFSTSMTGLYAVCTLQMLGYAIQTPALVMYVALYISEADSARAQAISACMATLGAIFSGCIGGLLYDSLSVRATLLIGAAVAALGAAVCQLSVEKPKRFIR